MKVLNQCIVLFVLFFCTSANAIEPRNGDIWGQAGLFVSRFNPAHESMSFKDSRFSPGIFAFGQIHNDHFLELGIYSDFEHYSRTNNGFTKVEGIDRLIFSTGYLRRWNFHWSGGVSLFSSYSMGDPKPLSEINTDFSTSASDSAEHGLDWVISWHPSGSRQKGLVMKAIYSMNLTSKSKESADHVGLFLSYQFLVQRGLTTEQKEELRNIKLERSKLMKDQIDEKYRKGG